MFQLRAEQTLARLQSALQAHDIETIVLKGPHLGSVVYSDPSERPFCDLDVLIRSSRVREAIRALEAAGFDLCAPSTDRPYSDRVQYSAHLTTPGGVPIDLHHDFSAYERYPVDVEAMFSRAVPFTFGGVPTLGLGPTDLLFSLCLHAVRSYLQIERKHIRDMALVTTHQVVDWTLFGQMVKTARCSRGTYYALRAAALQDGARVPSRVLKILRPSPPWHAYLGLFVDERRFPLIRWGMGRAAVQRALGLPLMDDVSAWPRLLARYGKLRLADWWWRS